jgi:hypothetical protein
MSQTQGHEVSPENIASSKRLILWGFWQVFAGSKADIKSAWTVWRSLQSAANCSLQSIPDNREKYREFFLILVSLLLP